MLSSTGSALPVQRRADPATGSPGITQFYFTSQPFDISWITVQVKCRTTDNTYREKDEQLCDPNQGVWKCVEKLSTRLPRTLVGAWERIAQCHHPLYVLIPHFTYLLEVNIQPSVCYKGDCYRALDTDVPPSGSSRAM